MTVSFMSEDLVTPDIYSDLRLKNMFKDGESKLQKTEQPQFLVSGSL